MDNATGGRDSDHCGFVVGCTRVRDKPPKFFHRQPSRRFGNIGTVARRKLRMLDDAEKLMDMAAVPGNRLEALGGDRKGQHPFIREKSFAKSSCLLSACRRTSWLWRCGPRFSLTMSLMRVAGRSVCGTEGPTVRRNRRLCRWRAHCGVLRRERLIFCSRLAVLSRVPVVL